MSYADFHPDYRKAQYAGDWIAMIALAQKCIDKGLESPKSEAASYYWGNKLGLCFGTLLCATTETRAPNGLPAWDPAWPKLKTYTLPTELRPRSLWCRLLVQAWEVGALEILDPCQETKP